MCDTVGPFDTWIFIACALPGLFTNIRFTSVSTLDRRILLRQDMIILQPLAIMPSRLQCSVSGPDNASKIPQGLAPKKVSLKKAL
jgi:hypothetical protein